MTATIIQGDARQTGLLNAFFHCVATSPPYYGLREYGDDDREIGDEKTPNEYIDEIRKVGSEVWRVLRDDGTWWLNLGDSFGSSKNLLMIPQRIALALQADGWIIRAQIPWVKASCMPESVRDRPTIAHEYVFLLVKSQQYFWDADAVRVRHSQKSMQRYEYGLHKTRKEGAIKNSVADRQHFGMSQSEKMGDFMNQHGRNLRTSDFFNAGLDEYAAHIAHVRENGGLLLSSEGDPLAFLVNPVGNKLAHFAMWPPRLVAPMIKASTSEKGCCPKCGAIWMRIVESGKSHYQQLQADEGVAWAEMDRVAHEQGTIVSRGEGGQTRNKNGTVPSLRGKKRTTKGFAPSCECNAGDPIPCRVLDPFAGSGTTLQVAEALGRDSWGVELMAKNIPIIGERLKEKLDPKSLTPIARQVVSESQTSLPWT